MDQALNAEEQKLFDQMRDGDAGAKDAPKVEAKVETKPEAKQEPKQEQKVEAKADVKAEAKAEAKGEEKPAKMVPVEALAEARHLNKELRKELEAAKQLVTKGNENLQKFMDAVQKKADGPAPPKFEDDPAGALKAENEALRKGLAEIQDKIAKQDQAADHGTKLNQHAVAVKARESEFAKEHPDYWKASDHVVAVWTEEFREAGFDEEAIPQMVFNKALVTTGQALHKGKDPAAAIWAIAKRLGFTEGKVEAKAEAKQEKPSGETKLEQIAKGQEAAKSAGGGNGPDDTTFASLAQMDESQIERLIADPDWWSKNIRQSPLRH